MKSSDRATRWWLVAIVAFAAILRFWSIDHGLPFSYYGDEQHFVKRSVAFGSGDLNPHWFHKPAFFMYALFAEYVGYYGVGRVFGWWSGTDGFAQQFFDDPTWFFLLGRITASLFGVGLVLVGFACGRRLGGDRVGLITAAMLASSTCLAEAGRWVKADVPGAFFALLGTYYLIRIVQDGRWRDYLLAGAAIGIGIATKYYAIALLPSIWLAHALRRSGDGALRRARPWGPLAATGMAIALFFAGSPYNFLDSTWWTLNLEPRLDHIFTTKLGIPLFAFAGITQPPDFFDGAANLIRCLFQADCVGWIWGPLGLLGLFLPAVRGSRAAWVPLCCVLPFAIAAILWNPIDFQPRYLSAIVPIFGLSAAMLLSMAWDALRARRRVPGWVGVAAVAVAIAPSTARVIDWNARYGRPDTRTVALRWIEENLPAGAVILNDNEHVKLRQNAAAIRREFDEVRSLKKAGVEGPFMTRAKEMQFEFALASARAAEARGEKTFAAHTQRHPWWHAGEETGKHEADTDMGLPVNRSVPTPRDLEEMGIEYVVTTAKTYNDYRPGGVFADKKRWVAFYEWLHTRPLIYEIPRRLDYRPGPEVRIYAIRETTR